MFWYHPISENERTRIMRETLANLKGEGKGEKANIPYEAVAVAREIVDEIPAKNLHNLTPIQSKLYEQIGRQLDKMEELKRDHIGMLVLRYPE